MSVKPTSSDNEHVYKQIEQGLVPNFAFVLDRSPKSRQLIASMKTGPATMRARTNDPVFARWEASNSRFIVLCGSWGTTAGVAYEAATIRQLLDNALPRVMAWTLSTGGLCAFTRAVEDRWLAPIESRIAELHPLRGPARVKQ